MLFLSTLIVVFSFILTFSLSGCGQAGSPVEEETSQEEATDDPEEISEEADESTEDTSEETTENTEEDPEDNSSLANMEITGNINILSGLELSDSVQNSRPVIVMIGNSTPARPQSGLNNADIVFEVVDEYGITRCVAIFSSYDAEIIAPCRSARIYYAEIARSFDPIYTFWGTYEDAYPVIKSLDMDFLDANSAADVPSAWRDHTRYDIGWLSGRLSTLGIKDDAVKHGYSLEGGQSPMKFKLDALEPDRGSVKDVSINISIDDYLVDFTYDKKENYYLKSVAGSPHIDFDSGEQLRVNNVIVLVTDIGGPIDQYGHMVVRTTGTHEIGQAYFFMDGNVVEGSWGRNSAFDTFEFSDLEGDPVLFNRGSTWILMIPSIDRLIY